MNCKTFVASASAIESSDLYMTIKTVLFTTPSANLNGVRCTIDFMKEIVENQDKYVGLPLCIDASAVAEGKLNRLGHCYDSATDTFSSTMIGSFYDFEIVELGNGETALVGYARVLKRNKAICSALSDLFLRQQLKFSFEISVGDYKELDDGTILIDRADCNKLEGMAVVSMPACPEAVALELVAELQEKGMEESMECKVIEEKIIVDAEEVSIVEEPNAEDGIDATLEAKEKRCAELEALISDMEKRLEQLTAELVAAHACETIIAEDESVTDPVNEVKECQVETPPVASEEPHVEADVLSAVNPFVETNDGIAVGGSRYSLLDEIPETKYSTWTLI